MNKITNKIKTFFSYAKKHKNKTAIVCIVILMITIFALNIQSSYATDVTGSTVTTTRNGKTYKWNTILSYTSNCSAATSCTITGSVSMKSGNDLGEVGKYITACSLTGGGTSRGTCSASSFSLVKTTKVVIATKTWTVTKGHSAVNHSIVGTVALGKTSSGTSAWKGTSTASVSVSIPAKASYTVSYNANGGSGAPGSQTKWYGENLTLSSTTPTRTGYTFGGWNTNSTGTGTNYASGATYTGNAALTLYAKWNGSSYTLKINPNGGSISGNTEEQTMSPNLILGTTNWNNITSYVPTREGYTFLGYYSQPGEGGDLVYDASGLAVQGAYWSGSGNSAKYNNMTDLTAYAKWRKNTETVTFDAEGGTVSETSREITRGSTYGTLPTPTKSKYTFENWQYVPKGYQQVEYIESSGTQYIDTGYKPNEDTGVLATYQFSEVSTLQQRVYGVHGIDTDTDSVSYAHYINGSGGMSYAYKDGTGNWIVTGTTAATTKMTFKENVDQRYISMNGAANTPIQGKITRTSKYNLTIMTGVEPDGSINQYGKLKLYEFNIYEDGNLIRQYVPCYRTSDNEIGLYETKEKKFYTNKGTGTFTKGNDTHIETTTKIVEGNHKLYARYSIPNTSYEVDFDANGGSGEMEEQVMEYDTEETLKNNAFTKEGYNFMGWNTNNKAQGKWYREVTGVSNIASKQSGERKKTLYAQWAKKSYAKIYKKNSEELEKDSYGNYVISIKK